MDDQNQVPTTPTTDEPTTGQPPMGDTPAAPATPDMGGGMPAPTAGDMPADEEDKPADQPAA